MNFNGKQYISQIKGMYLTVHHVVSTCGHYRRYFRYTKVLIVLLVLVTTAGVTLDVLNMRCLIPSPICIKCYSRSRVLFLN